MQEPKIHSLITGKLPRNHWLLKHWESHPDPSDPRVETVCEHCGRLIYHPTNGTLTPWVETGRIVDRHGHEEPLTPCLACFARYASEWDQYWPMYALTDKGGPQSYDGN